MLKHFSRKEFLRDDGNGNVLDWWPWLAPGLASYLDALREAHGQRIDISPAPGAIGRWADPAKVGSRHNVARWREVMAVDIMPHGIDTREDAERFVLLAAEAGFSGIGFYPHWLPRPGFHVDLRPEPGRWGGRRSLADGKQVLISLPQALDLMP